MNATKQLVILVFSLCCSIVVVAPVALRADTFVVTNTNDSGEGSLRDSLESAADGDTILATNVSGTITLTSGELVITNNVTIIGPGPASLAVDGGGTTRVFNIGNISTVTISGLAITNGADTDHAGGIFNDQSTLTLSNCSVSGNSSTFFGGGIYNNGVEGSATLIILNSRISGNLSANGGGIFNDGVGGLAAITILNSTLSDNSAGAGGGIHNDGAFSGTATLAITNSTFSGNSAGAGGGIYNDGVEGDAELTMANSTFSGNLADNGVGGGVHITGTDGFATLDIGNTILNAGASGANLVNDSGTITSTGYNLSSDSGGGFLTDPTDLVSTNALLEPLANNGGPTFTHALMPCSPAVDAVPTNATCLATDQRGLARPQGPRCDIGAFELEAAEPVAMCTNVTVSAGTNCTAEASVDAGSSGDCITLSQSPAGPYGLGETEVILTVTDVHGASSTCTSTVTVVDTTAPSITCPGTATVNTDAGQCTASGVSLGSPTTNDNCSAVTVTNDAPENFSLGTNTVTWTAIDADGNSNTCAQLVIVVDDEPPTITCPTNVTVSTDAGECSASGVNLGSPISTNDNCGVGSVDNDAPGTFPLGDTVVTWTVADASGNTNSCQQTVTVVDTEPPSITCPANISTNTAPGACNSTNIAYSAMANDNCGDVLTNFCLPTSGSKFNVGTNTVACTAVDASGNTNTCTFTVTVADLQGPSITCPADILTNTAAGACNSTNITYSPIVSDNCAVLTNFCLPASGSKFDMGTNTVTCTAVDTASQTNTCSFTVTVVNTTPPEIACPSNLTVNATSADGAVVEFDDAAATVTCTNVATVECDRTSGSTFSVGTNAVTCTAVDVTGNSNSCTFVVIVKALPVAMCTNVTVSAVSNCTAEASIDDGSFGPDGEEVDLEQFPAGPYELGETIVVLTVTAHGVSSSCTGTVTVVDHTRPTISCPSDVSAAATSSEGATVHYDVPIATDNCAVQTNFCLPASGSTFPVGSTTVTCTATDDAGNSTNCTFDVTVKGPVELVFDLVTSIGDLPINPKLTKTLSHRVVKIGQKIVAGKNPNACKQLTNFIKKTASLHRKNKLTDDQANALINDSANIRQVLDCP
jgi:hypothetical protein